MRIEANPTVAQSTNQEEIIARAANQVVTFHNCVMQADDNL